MGFFKEYLPQYPKTMTLVLTGLMTALVCVATVLFQIPIPATGGYFNVGEAIIYIAAILFGPIVGGFAGGVGAALADAMSPYAIYAPGTLVIKFCEGFIIGFIVFAVRSKEWKRWKEYFVIISAVIIGGLIMVVGYWTYEAYILGLGPIVALGEVPLNLMQVGFGSLVAIPSGLGIRKALEINR
ncbi:MAG: ECF transporter S component [Candidatus Helarchaeota archaeon]|nr:ECF transporter S component [Candidatus Helarchaeota archaeon]